MRQTLCPLLALSVLSCSPPAEYTPEEATQRFVATASAEDVLEAAIEALKDKSFETGEAGDGFVQGSRFRRLTRTFEGTTMGDVTFKSNGFAEVPSVMFQWWNGERMPVLPVTPKWELKWMPPWDQR